MGPVKKTFFLEIGILTGETVANKILEGENGGEWRNVENGG